MKQGLLAFFRCLICILLLAQPARAQMAATLQEDGSPQTLPPLPVMTMPLAANTVDRLLRFDDPSATQSKTERMDSQLAALLAATRRGGSLPTSLDLSPALRVEGEQIHVQIAVDPGDAAAVTVAIEALGGLITGHSLDGRWLQGWVPIFNLAALGDLPMIQYVRPPERLTLLESPDDGVSSEALSAFNVDAWRESGRTGAGVRVAVIDGGFNGYRALLGRELPPTVTTTNFVDGEGLNAVEGRTNHGTAIAEIIYDIAPDVELLLVRVETNIDLAEAVEWLIHDQVDIISTSLGWYSLTPGDGSGELADLVAMAHEAGILWITSAGNDRRNHWGGHFADGDDDQVLDFAVGQEINYFGPAPGQSYQIPANFAINIFMRWNDWEDVEQDYDLYLMRWDGESWKEVASSRNQQSGMSGQKPTETIQFVTGGSATAYGILVERAHASKEIIPNLEIFIPKFYELTRIVHERSLTNLADAPLALTVAAVDRLIPYAVESYSGEGPTNGPGGSEGGGFAKPDIAAYTNVAVSSSSEKFSGTSAATPHVAGAAALIKAAFPDWSAEQIRYYLLNNAVDDELVGRDTRAGAGRLRLGSVPARMAASMLAMDADPLTSGLITFTLTLVNSSRFNAEIAVENSLPSGFEIHGDPITSAGPQPTIAVDRLTWQGTIPSQQRVEISYALQLPHSDQVLRIINLATITEDDGTQTHLQLLFNPHQIFVPVVSGD